MSVARLAVVRDFREERWPSMDLVTDMLMRELQADPSTNVRATEVCPTFRRRASLLPALRRLRAMLNIDRFINRYWEYPRHLRQLARDFDVFHVCDHSYAHLVHVLPAERTGVYCHDLDAFRCLLEPHLEPRSRLFREMARRVLRGLEKAAVVFHSTNEIRHLIEQYGVVNPCRLVQAAYGLAPEYSADPIDSDPSSGSMAAFGGAPFLLHVGSCARRKRIDVLLDVFAAVRVRQRDLRLVQVGGEWTAEQRGRIVSLGIGSVTTQLSGLDRRVLAELYRHATIVLQPSESEGFGLPVIEALACGAIVVASDIPVLREVGGPALVYCAPADRPAWEETVGRLLADPSGAPGRAARLAQAKRYSWTAHTRTILGTYLRLSENRVPRAATVA